MAGELDETNPPRWDDGAATADHDDPAKQAARRAAEHDLDGDWKAAARLRGRLGGLAKRRD